MSTEPFRIDVAETTLSDLRSRVANSRFTFATAPGWTKGADPAYLRDLTAYWAKDFDWRAAEARLNDHPQFLADVDGTRIHFVHVKAPRRDGAPEPLPLILSHGWPSSFVEMLPLVPLLSDRFDLVIPSLPGFGYSRLPDGALTRERIADLWHTLMTDVLGYSRFGAFGGDIGGGASQWLAAKYPDSVVGLHVIHPPAGGAGSTPSDGGPEPYTEAEQAFIDAEAAYDIEDQGYSEIMWTRPDTIGAALADSPVGLAAWIIDKYRDWSDCGGDVESRWDRDTLLTVITLYWVTESIGSSFRQYADYPHNRPRPTITVPVGVTLSHEPVMASFPRSLTERACTDLRHWSEPGRGGHFLAFEEPELMAAELRTFFATLTD
ncbi:epoxide hydrolase family protein [Stackebrandtia nassauensis]|uniref:Epoxide hydrolase domain protein n=1 Tax=Stackebrandtia nassauensis (strain DSM 44728 / CIP 108903 / NRRL B-16338 / NBRC 102104 / LLR-40K-21) TaxID=446470 RepID=D3PXC8_STANL|nr:epoxide hydrolase family protein [Stackebrandtia nassauensis]ADD41391.1 Epoxide hydrolase domain protein [Stackebrandtia nassauensis DSM 44728]